jgi:hypothetical protein
MSANLWNRNLKRIEISILKSFDIIYECVKFIVEEWCDIIVIHKKIERWKNICANKKINFYNYIINIHNFNLKLAYGW